MKILIAFYSRTGTTKKVAEVLKGKLSADIEEIISVKNRKGIFAWIISGKEGYKKELTGIEKTIKDPSEYDLVIAGTPVWAGMSSPIRTYLAQNKGKFKNFAAFCTMGSSPGETFKDAEIITGMKLLARLSLTTQEVKSNNSEEKINRFVEELKNLL